MNNYESKMHLVENTSINFYKAIDSESIGEYSLESDMNIRYFPSNLACAIIEEFGDDFAKKVARVILALTD